MPAAEAAAAAAAKRKPQKPEPARAARASRRQHQQLLRAMGTVMLAVSPWGEVSVDGASRGVSPPLTQLSLPPGVHTIEIRNGAAAPFVARVEVRSGETLGLQHRF